jgi:tRNA nucleotidyltransferase/poly(A) polymerase
MTTISLAAFLTRRTAQAFLNPIQKIQRHDPPATRSRLAALDSRQLRFYGNYDNDYSEDGGNNTSGGFPAFWESLSRSFLPASMVSTTEPLLSKILVGENVPSNQAQAQTQPAVPSSFMASMSSIPQAEAKRGYGPYIKLSAEERDLFRLLRRAREETELATTLRVAGGWVRDKLLSTPEFSRKHHDQSRLTSKYKQGAPSMGRQGTKVLNSDENQPVDIDIALDDMLGREFADHLNEYLAQVGEKTHSVGVVLKNPEKSKHLETATMKVGTFWIDFVNLRAEEYTQDSRIPDLMRIGSPAEDAFRRDLTINSLFYNVNNGQVEDWTGRGFDDLRRGIVATPLAPLTTLLDDPLRALRSVRFAARLRFTMDDSLVEAAMDSRVRKALAEKVSRERVGGEVDLMLRSPDPVGAMRLLINLNLASTVFPLEDCFDDADCVAPLFEHGLELLSETHEHLTDCRVFPPSWCQKSGTYTTHGVNELTLREDDDSRRYLWYASFLKPVYDHSKELAKNNKTSRRQGKKANRSTICRLLVDELKRPSRESESVEKIMSGANHFTRLIDSGCDISAISVLLSDIRVEDDSSSSSTKLKCYMGGKRVFSASEEDPMWQHAMEFRLLCSKVVKKVGPLWRAALFLSLSERLTENFLGDLEYVIEGDIVDESQEERRLGEHERYDAFATAMQRIGVIGIWDEKPLMDGKEIKVVLPAIPTGPAFRPVMEEQENWMISHPGAGAEFLVKHLLETFPEYASASN